MRGFGRSPSRRNRWLTPVFALFLIGIGAAAWITALEAQDAVLESKSGSISSVSLDPTAPGFRAFTEPTPTAVVLHTTVTGEGRAALVGLTVMVGADRDQGGTIITIPSTTLDPTGSNLALDELFMQGGFAAVVAELNDIFGIGFGEVVVLDAGSWTTLMAPDLPLQMTLRGDLFEDVSNAETRTVLEGGSRDFQVSEVALIAAHRNPGEPTLGVAVRQQEIWRAWISRTAGAGERPQLFAIEEGFVDLIGDLASGEVSFLLLPMTGSDGPASGEVRYAADRSAIRELVAQLVPFPLSPDPGARDSVMLLDGTGGRADQAALLAAVVRAGGQVAILGNAETFDISSTEVLVHDPGAVETARRIASELGVGEPVSVPLVEATVSITVTAGADRAADA